MPRPAAPASSGNLLEMETQASSQIYWIHRLWGWSPAIHVSTATQVIPNHIPRIGTQTIPFPFSFWLASDHMLFFSCLFLLWLPSILFDTKMNCFTPESSHLSPKRETKVNYFALKWLIYTSLLYTYFLPTPNDYIWFTENSGNSVCFHLVYQVFIFTSPV